MTETERWLLDHLREHGELPAGADEAALLEVNYVQAELLDSLGLVVMIGELEAAFEVQLEPEHMQDPRFCTVRGLAAIVDGARGA